MSKLLQINECLNFSTGKIAQQIGEVAINNGWESYIAYSGREPYIESKSKTIKVGSYIESCFHFAGQKLFDVEGFCSSTATRKLIRKIKEIDPDIIHLHNIHDHYLNLEILFQYLAESHKPVIWTQHDCWAFTGGCMYYDMIGCYEWKNNCEKCIDRKRALITRGHKNLSIRKELYKNINKLIFVPVSNWLSEALKQSIVSKFDIITIHNGIDINVFSPKFNKINDGNKRIIGVASTWDARKGLFDFVKLREMLPSNFIITLVGLSKKQISILPKGINGIGITESIDQLVKLYCEADIFVNPTYSDNFPTTNIEALACGTPVITYETGGSPEAIDEKTGVVVEQGNVKKLADSIIYLSENTLSSSDCRKRALQLFNKDERFMDYINLYNKILKYGISK